jgi:methionyl-tRNA formyltransferase
MVGAARLRLVFFGTPDFAVPTLDALLRSRHRVVGVVTRADRPRGRGQKTSEPPVKARAIAAGLPVLQPERLKDEGFLAAFAAFNPDLIVLAAYGKILTDAVLATPRLGVLNVHASLLPSYRGAAPVHRAVLNGDRETGVTIMKMVKALDAGPMLAAVRHPIGPDETSEDVERALGQIGAELLVATVDALAAGPVPEVPQDDAAATYAHRITKEDGVVDWTLPAVRIHDLIRGLYPWPHASTFYRGRRLILLRSAVMEKGSGSFFLGQSGHSADSPEAAVFQPDRIMTTIPKRGRESFFSDDFEKTLATTGDLAPAVAAEKKTPDPFSPGTILEAAGDRLHVATGGGTLAITQIQVEGRRPMTSREFLAGHPLAAGEMLTPHP